MKDKLPCEAGKPASMHGFEITKPMIAATDKMYIDSPQRIEAIVQALPKSNDQVLEQVERTLGIRVHLTGRSPRKLKWYERWQNLMLLLGALALMFLWTDQTLAVLGLVCFGESPRLQ